MPEWFCRASSLYKIENLDSRQEHAGMTNQQKSIAAVALGAHPKKQLDYSGKRKRSFIFFLL